MAKRIADEDIKLNVIINSEKAKKELFQLEEAQIRLRKQVSSLKLEKDKLERSGQKESARYKEINAELKSLNSEVKKNEVRMSELRKAIGITGLTINQLRQRANELRTSMLHMTPGSAQFRQMQTELAAINARMSQLRANSQATGLSLGKVADGFNRYAALGASVIATTTGVVLGLSKTIGYSKELDDQMADVRKTTGLTVEELKQLDSIIGQINTRTSRIDLLKFAEEAGRLGKTTIEEISEFVVVADKISVALGSDFQGNVDETVRVMGKLAEQYKVGAEFGASNAEGMEMIGSAINEVGMAGSNTAPFLVDYLKRLVGISAQAKVSAADQIGFAAAFDEAGQSVEVSATVMSNLIASMMKKPEEFAKAAKMPVEDFKKLLSEDVNEALLAFGSGVDSGEAGLAQFVQNIGDLGVDGERATGVLGTLASNVDKIRERQELSNKALSEGTSLQEEFNVKNNNFAATMDKLQKRVMGFVADNGFTRWAKESLMWMAGLLNVTEDADGRFAKLRNRIVIFLKILALAATGFISYKAAVLLARLATASLAQSIAALAVVQKASAITHRIYRNSLYLLSAGKNLLTGNTVMATAALRKFNLMLFANPLGGIIALVATATAAYLLFAESADRATAAQKALRSVQLEADKEVGSRIRQIQFLVSVAKDETKSLGERKAAIEELKEIAPDHLNNLELEKIGYLETTKAIESLTESMRKEAELKAVNALLDQKHTEKIELENTAIEKQITFTDRLLGILSRNGSVMFTAKRRKENVDAIDEEIKALEKLREELFKEKNARAAINEPEGEPSGDGSGDGGSDPNGEKRAEALAKLNEKLKELRRELELSNMEADEREVEAVRDKYQKLIDENKQFTEQVKQLEALREQEIAALRVKQEERRAEAAKNFMAKFHQETLDERLKADIEQADALLKQGILNEEQYDLVISAIRKKHQDDVDKAEEDRQRKRNQILRKTGARTLEQEYDENLRQLQGALETELITYDEFIDAKKKIDEEYADSVKKLEDEIAKEKLEKITNYISESARAIREISGIVSAAKDLELAGVEEVTQRKGESEEEFTKRKEEAEKIRGEIIKKYAYREALAKVANIVASTAEAVMKSVSASPTTFGLPWSAINGAIGLTQAGIAMAEAQKIKGYEDGLYPVIDQYNRKYKAPVMANAKTGPINEPTILVGEKPEIIIDPKTKKHLEMNYPEVIETIYQSAGRMKGYESGYYPQQKTMPTPAPVKGDDGIDIRALLAKIERLFDRGVPAYFGESEIRKIRASIRAQEENEKKRILK